MNKRDKKVVHRYLSEIGKADVTWIAEQLMKNGPRTCWVIGRRLCQ